MAFSLDRDGASRRLGVSSRTIDRHIQAGRIRTRRIGKKMFLEEDDIETLRLIDPARREEDFIIINDISLDTATPESNRPEFVARSKNIVNTNHNNVTLTEIVRIYEDARDQIAKKDSIIQELSYKLGKAETELSNSVPALEYKKNSFLLESAKSRSDIDAEILSKKIITLESDINKRNSALISLAILFILVLGFSVIFVIFGGMLK
ncbi:hypothetical protein H7169_00380 [Candidatus Gracilibacteria bacterium]|nr:hypothetical protein [Candidatus Gracilibacteria bacterium]